MEEIDLGKETFVGKWPTWLRWLLFIPAAIIAPMIFILIQSIFSNWFLDLGPNAFYLNLLRGVTYGAGIVVVGSMVAPKKQRVVALIFLITIAMMSGVALLYQSSHFVLNEFLEDIVTLIAAGWATYYIFNETK